ncbi:MAG: hypothetical protein ABII12_03720 [Planctomycetota bacterium]
MADEGVGSRDLVKQIESDGFVEVMFTKSMSEATDCRRLLLARQIPAEVEADPNVSRQCGIAVLVPANRVVEASELLAARAQDNHSFDDDYVEIDDLDGDDDFDDDDDDDEEEFADDYDDDLDDDDDNLEDDDDY